MACVSSEEMGRRLDNAPRGQRSHGGSGEFNRNFKKVVDPVPQQSEFLIGAQKEKPNECSNPIEVPIPVRSQKMNNGCECPPGMTKISAAEEPACIVKIATAKTYQPVFSCQPCRTPDPPKVWVVKESPIPQRVGTFNKLLFLLLSVCVHLGEPGPDNMICVPCSPAVICVGDQTGNGNGNGNGNGKGNGNGNGASGRKGNGKGSGNGGCGGRNPDEPKGPNTVSGTPRDYIYRCESRELRMGNLYANCKCARRDGLQDDCPRSPCQGRPCCLKTPWPDCWPSGGCHGIDYSRQVGYKRFNPDIAMRPDKPQCSGGNRGGNQSKDRNEQGGCEGSNTVYIVCPPGCGM